MELKVINDLEFCEIDDFQVAKNKSYPDVVSPDLIANFNNIKSKRWLDNHVFHCFRNEFDIEPITDKHFLGYRISNDSWDFFLKVNKDHEFPAWNAVSQHLWTQVAQMAWKKVITPILAYNLPKKDRSWNIQEFIPGLIPVNQIEAEISKQMMVLDPSGTTYETTLAQLEERLKLVIQLWDQVRLSEHEVNKFLETDPALIRSFPDHAVCDFELRNSYLDDSQDLVFFDLYIESKK